MKGFKAKKRTSKNECAVQEQEVCVFCLSIGVDRHNCVLCAVR